MIFHPQINFISQTDFINYRLRQADAARVTDSNELGFHDSDHNVITGGTEIKLEVTRGHSDSSFRWGELDQTLRMLTALRHLTRQVNRIDDNLHGTRTRSDLRRVKPLIRILVASSRRTLLYERTI